jgi:hypothetical protein
LKTLDARNLAAFLYWQKCRATQRFPDDAIVGWYSRVIQSVFDAHEVQHREVMRSLLFSLAGVKNV